MSTISSRPADERSLPDGSPADEPDGGPGGGRLATPDGGQVSGLDEHVSGQPGGQADEQIGRQDDGPDGPRERAYRAARHFGPALTVFGLAKLLGFVSFLYLLNAGGDFRTKDPRFGGGATVWDVLQSWDGWWYQNVAANGYHPQLVALAPGQLMTLDQNSAAFFPLYPGLMRLVSDCTGLGLYGAGMLVSVVSSFVAAAGIFAVTAKLTDRRTGIIAAAVWAVFPGSGAEWAVYSDSLFVALAAWACYAVLTRRWLEAGVITLVAGLNRPTATALIAALGVAGLISLYRREDGIARPLTAMLISPLGLFGYVLWVGWRMGDLSGYFTLQRGAWIHYFDYGQHTGDVLRGVLFGHTDYLFTYPTEDLIAFLLVLAVPVLLFLLLRLRTPAFLIVYTLVTVVMVLGSQQIFGNTSRYLLPAFPLFVPLALALRRVSLSSLVMIFGVAAAASGWYAGYVIFELGVP
ncbi:membrane protein [Kitasatospora kazusensis]|uniref:Membrane protein n=1 Tax=Kitasatospora kazusensis TaxID=407974 RepID=A0ABN2YYZ6_9ACTN